MPSATASSSSTEAPSSRRALPMTSRSGPAGRSAKSCRATLPMSTPLQMPGHCFPRPGRVCAHRGVGPREHSHRRSGTLSAALSKLNEARYRADDIGLRARRWDDVFLSLTGGRGGFKGGQ